MLAASAPPKSYNSQQTVNQGASYVHAQHPSSWAHLKNLHIRAKETASRMDFLPEPHLLMGPLGPGPVKFLNLGAPSKF